MGDEHINRALQPGAFIIITDEFGNQRIEIIKEVTDAGITTIGTPHTAPIGKSMEAVELLDNYPPWLQRYYYENGKYVYHLFGL